MFPWERKKLLTERMKQIVRLRYRRYTNKEIAEMLGVSKSDIDMLCHKVLQRTKCSKMRDVRLAEADNINESNYVTDTIKGKLKDNSSRPNLDLSNSKIQ